MDALVESFDDLLEKIMKLFTDEKDFFKLIKVYKYLYTMYSIYAYFSMYLYL